MKMIESGIWLVCRKCGKEKEMKKYDGSHMPHSTPNNKIVAWFRKRGWTCTTNGYRAKCPKCQ